MGFLEKHGSQILGMGAGTASNIVSGGLNALYTNWLNKKNAERNQKYWEKQNQILYNQSEQSAQNAHYRTIDIYNKLQSPEAIKQQLLDAGLNPALMYSQGGMGGSVSSGAQATPQAGSGAPTLGIQQIVDPMTSAQIANIMADTKKKEAEKDNLEQKTASEKLNQTLIEAQTEWQKIENQIKNNDLNVSNATIEETIEKIKVDYQNAKEELDKLKLENKFNQETYEDKLKQMQQKTANDIAQGNIMIETLNKIKAITENTQMDTKVKEAEIKKIQQQTQLFKYQVFETINKTNLLLHESNLTKAETEYTNALKENIGKTFEATYGNDWNKQDWFNLAEMIIKSIMAGLGFYLGTSKAGQATNVKNNMGNTTQQTYTINSTN